ncbi:hypothetical protein [Cytophaga hutchinsonii]|uniref:Uncharacterized protein n=1 Tax=Cytophaga hutchinsonii (strain ATCC 33406 / DSM 1761 / CIP 103989 / NBRC 15051 / NCIMB 9469 / D465) TaxID=269798 RepID=A0A6N4SS26_CYTH3|nr:hypothetical protein [Cytophaga hutchinsonii]ABG59093.1 hypothetical protein CHU_1826 [Cytophaga hutchinsonii ATCC 33406]SFX37029.1 hypothetical protein SAMN04487930_103215 [Cytophaga hutchinsonii ATCC 33406]
MKQLDPDWLTKGLIDFEYKKYQLLGYLNSVRNDFNDRKLYPPLSELYGHYQTLISIKNNKQNLKQSFPKEITAADNDKAEFLYRELIADDKLMQEIEDILSFAIPAFENGLREGRAIYEDVEQSLKIEPIGLEPLYTDAGYILLNQPPDKEMHVYQYDITIFHHANEKFRGIHTKKIDSFKESVSNTVNSMKLGLIKKYPELPNPATYLIQTQIRYPEKETVMPVAQLALVRYLSTKTV